MEDSPPSSNAPQNDTSTETVIITPSQLEKMGLIVRQKDSADFQALEKIDSADSQLKKFDSAKAPEVKSDLKIDPNKIKKKLCTLLNHTPLVMQVKGSNWMTPEKEDRPLFSLNVKNESSDDPEEKPKFKIVSDEKSNLSASEIENMLSTAKSIKSDDTISSPTQKNRTEDFVIKVESEDSQSTSKESTINDPGILKKECLKRIQAKMYENLKKVLNEVDALPLKDKACLSVKPVMISGTEVAKTGSGKQLDGGKVAEKPKENKPCYMSVYRERKISQDVEKTKEEPSRNDFSFEIQPKSKIVPKMYVNEVIKIDDELEDNLRVPKKRKRSPTDSGGEYQAYDDGNDSLIVIPDNDAADGLQKDNKNKSPNKNIVTQTYRLVKKTARKKSQPPLVVKGKGSAKMINTSKVVRDKTPKRRGRPRKIKQVETISIVVEEIDDSESEKEPDANAFENAKIPVSDTNELPRRKRGRPPKNRSHETPVNNRNSTELSSPPVPDADATQTESNTKDANQTETQATPRKRGRPRKIRPEVLKDAEEEPPTRKDGPSVSENPEPKEELDASAQIESQNNNTPVQVKKKRGRKSKAELAELAKLRKNEPEVEEEREEMWSQPRTSGRKRKVVDYNILNGEDSDVEEPQVKIQRSATSYIRRSFTSNKTHAKSSNDEYGSSKSTYKKRAESENSEEDDDEIEKSEDEDDRVSIKEKPIRSAKIEDTSDRTGTGKADDKEDKEGNEENAAKKSDEDAKRSDDIATDKEIADNKTVQVEDQEAHVSKLDEDSTHPQNDDIKSEDGEVEERKLKDDEVRCAICEEIVQENLWSEHKRMVHNDLAWFAGEQSLNLDDTAFVEETLNAILREDGVLKCPAGDMQTDSLESFVQHKQDCKMCLAKNKTRDKTDSEGKRKKKPRPGGTAEVLSFLFTNFANKRKDKSSEISSADGIDDNDERSALQDGQPVIRRDQTQCAVCLKIISKSQWLYHKLSVHNNLAWKVGDKPLDLNNKSLVVKILHELCVKKKLLCCDVCGQTRKSVVGFLSHKSQCQKSNEELADLKVKCKLCNRKMLLVSVSRHMILSHSGSVPDTVEASANEIEEDTGSKRKAASRAFELIQTIKEDVSAKINDILKGIRFRSADEAITKFNNDIQHFGEASCVYENCDYVAAEVEDLLQHMEVCLERCNDGYTCNFCLATFQYKRAAKEHVVAVHSHDDQESVIISGVQSDDEAIELGNDDAGDNDGDVICTKRATTKPQKRNRQLHFSVNFLSGFKRKTINCCYSIAFKWTLDYHKENYTAEGLFSNILSDQSHWWKMNDSKLLEYLPKLKRSIDVATLKLDHMNIPSKQNYKWTNYKLFQSAIDADGTSTIFCGGPISAMAWVPIPYRQNNVDQFLAVSVQPDPDGKYYGSHKYRDKGMVQFWNFGVLKNKTKPTHKPRLEFCLAHDWGVVWCMEWCPSGCYDTQDDVKPFSRLGMLALACSDSAVYVYTVPKPQELCGKIFQSKPSLKLIIDGSVDLDLGERFYHATKISWSKAAGHSYLAVGYSNGVIGIFNLSTISKLLSKTADGVAVVKPIHAFQGHNDAITALTLHHLENGNRWLMSGSLDKESKLWDLRNTSEPLNSLKKYIITDGVWSMHWLCPIYTFQHSTGFGSAPSGLTPARNYNGIMSTFLPSNSRTTSISCSDWGNLFLQANESGEVVCGFPDQLHIGFENDKRRMIRRCRLLASYTACVAKNLTPEERLRREETKMAIMNNKKKWNDVGDVNLLEPKTYSEACCSYGFVFCDMNKSTQYQHPSIELDKLLQSPTFHSTSKPDMYPLQSINKIAVNPNKNSYLFYSCGYQVGFVRTSSLMFLNSNSDIKL